MLFEVYIRDVHIYIHTSLLLFFYTPSLRELEGSKTRANKTAEGKLAKKNRKYRHTGIDFYTNTESNNNIVRDEKTV